MHFLLSTSPPHAQSRYQWTHLVLVYFILQYAGEGVQPLAPLREAPKPGCGAFVGVNCKQRWQRPVSLPPIAPVLLAPEIATQPWSPPLQEVLGQASHQGNDGVDRCVALLFS